MPKPSTLSPAERAQLLAMTFHSLEDHPAVIDWDPVALDRWAATVASHGERLAAQFVLRVWNSLEEWQCGRFDPIEAYHTWDRAHWAAFATWVKDPYTL